MKTLTLNASGLSFNNHIIDLGMLPETIQLKKPAKITNYLSKEYDKFIKYYKEDFKFMDDSLSHKNQLRIFNGETIIPGEVHHITNVSDVNDTEHGSDKINYSVDKIISSVGEVYRYEFEVTSALGFRLEFIIVRV